MSQAIGGLPEDLAEVVRLRLFDERTVPEIAKLLDVGESAVKDRFRKGAMSYRKRLSSLLSPESPGSDD